MGRKRASREEKEVWYHRILNYMLKYLEAHDYMPTREEINFAMRAEYPGKNNSDFALTMRIEEMKAHGLLIRREFAARAITITPKGRLYAAQEKAGKLPDKDVRKAKYGKPSRKLQPDTPQAS